MKASKSKARTEAGNGDLQRRAALARARVGRQMFSDEGLRRPRYFPVVVSERSMMGRLVELAFRRHYGEVYRFLLRRTADPVEAEELTQRVFADAAAAEEQLERDQRPLLPWLLAVAHRRWVDERRRNQRQRHAFETVGADLDRAGTSDAELAAVIRRALDLLPEEQREVVVRRLLRGQSFRDIAIEMAGSEGAMKMRFRRGLETLRRLLDEAGYAP